MSTTKSIDLKRFKNAVGIIVTARCEFGNTRKAAMSRVTIDERASATEETTAKTRMKLSKQLIASKEYEAIKSFQGSIRSWLYANSVPSFFKEGFQLCNLAGVEAIETRLRKAQVELAALVQSFRNVYPSQIEDARRVLEPVGQFNPLDYPGADALPGMFGIDWNWIAFAVPEGLPAELRAAEQSKMEKQFADAGEQITQALRSGFQELIAHATAKLAAKPGEKGATFRDSLVGNITDFIETFNRRNITDDIELQKLVMQARQILVGVTPQKLRDKADVRETTREAFSQINQQLGTMIMNQPARRFDFSEPEPTPAAAGVVSPEERRNRNVGEMMSAIP